MSDAADTAPAISIAMLTENTLALAAPLVAQYLWPDQEGDEPVARAALHLRQLLAWPSAHLFLAMAGERAAGFAAVHWGFSTRQGQPFLRIQDLYTHPSYRRLGVARVLMQYLADWARQQGSQRLELVTDTQNVAARALYDALGFEWFPEKEVYMRFLG